MTDDYNCYKTKWVGFTKTRGRLKTKRELFEESRRNLQFNGWRICARVFSEQYDASIKYGWYWTIKNRDKYWWPEERGRCELKEYSYDFELAPELLNPANWWYGAEKAETGELDVVFAHDLICTDSKDESYMAVQDCYPHHAKKCCECDYYVEDKRLDRGW